MLTTRQGFFVSACVASFLLGVSGAPAIGEIHTRDGKVTVTTAMCREYGAGNAATSLCRRFDGLDNVKAADCHDLQSTMAGAESKTFTVNPSDFKVGYGAYGMCKIELDNSNAAPVAGGDITVTMDQPALSKWVGEWTDKCFTGGKDKSFNAFQCTITSPEMVISVFNGVLPS